MDQINEHQLTRTGQERMHRIGTDLRVQTMTTMV